MPAPSMNRSRRTRRGASTVPSGTRGRPKRGPDRVSLARVLSKFGIVSRAQAVSAIAGGRVTVNGAVVRLPSLRVDPRSDRIAVDGKVVAKRQRVYIVMNKPTGVVTTRSDERGRQTVYQYLPPGTPWVFPIGRLDRDTEGLLLLTNDTRLVEGIASPMRGAEKTYEATLDRPLSESHRASMSAGLTLADGTILRPCVVRPAGADARKAIFILREGKNRQIRRMCEECGYGILALRRIAIGPLRLGDLPVGGSRPLSAREQTELLTLIQ